MRPFSALPLIAALLAACGAQDTVQRGDAKSPPASAQTPPVRHVGERCVYMRQRPVSYSTGRDTLSVSVDADICREAAVVLEIRDPVGGLVATDSFPLRDHGGPGEAYDFEAVQDMLEAIIDSARTLDARSLPSAEDAMGTTTGSPDRVRLHAPQAMYARAREIGGPILCWPVRRDAIKCIWLDPESRRSFALYGAPIEPAG